MIHIGGHVVIRLGALISDGHGFVYAVHQTIFFFIDFLPLSPPSADSSMQ